jgi:quinol-cytochrome oxidoreductase complex cytochrome b subunit
MKIPRHHWRHYFGGVALLMLMVQLLSGVFLTLFYQPHLDEAYASVQVLYKDLAGAAWVRDSHRWTALLLFAAIVVHMVRSLLRKDFLTRQKRTVWLTGSLLLLPLLAVLVTGFILPWEWKGYWFMEMVPNYLGHIPLIGPSVKSFLIDTFTANRNFVAHVVILPVVSIVLIDLHILSKIRGRKGRIPGYLLRHGLVTLPFFVAVAVLAFGVPMPTQDPEIIPMPLEGSHVPAPEWFFLILLVPFMYFKGAMGPFLGLLVPFVLFLMLTLLPYIFGERRDATNKRETGHIPARPVRRFGTVATRGFTGKAVAFLSVLVVAAGLFALLYSGTHRSPTLGCNSCHNVSMGARMGVPPDAFKDRSILPLLDDSQWMVEHWFYPQIVW